VAEPAPIHPAEPVAPAEPAEPTAPVPPTQAAPDRSGWATAAVTPQDADTGWEHPTFSRAERDRRWARVRELMEQHDVDCIVGSAVTGIQGRAHADVKYLTQLGNNDEQFGVVFPREGTPVAIGWLGRRPGDDWMEDRRGLQGSFVAEATWGRTIGSIVAELGLDEATIAVCGLGPGGPELASAIRQTDGYIPYLTMRTIEAALPACRFVDAAPILGAARHVKGDEEIEFVRRGVALAESALYALAGSARVGAFEPQVYAGMLAAEVAAGGTLPTMISWSSGPIGRPNTRLEQPVPRVMRDGDLVSVEIEGRWAGYNGQVDVTLTVGTVPAWAARAHGVAAEAVQAGIEALRPGVTYGEVRRLVNEVGTRGDLETRLIIHGRGLGDDGPLVGVPGPQDHLPVLEDVCLVVKPAVMHRGRFCARVGESVVVRAGGAERLGRRPLDHRWHVD
jgi:Xaa-Pro dipeptidase